MRLFDGQVKRPGEINGKDVFDVGFNFGSGGSASVSTRQWDKAANRVINEKPLNFRYAELPKENAELFSGPDTVQGREQKLQVSNTNRLKAIRDFLGDKSHAFVLYETDENLGIPEFANGKRRNRERVASFVGGKNWSRDQRQYRVGEEGETYDKGGAGLLWGSDVMQGVSIKDMSGRTVGRYDYKVGTGTSVWNAAAKLGDYTSNSIRYNNWGENNPMASAILGGFGRRPHRGPARPDQSFDDGRHGRRGQDRHQIRQGRRQRGQGRESRQPDHQDRQADLRIHGEDLAQGLQRPDVLPRRHGRLQPLGGRGDRKSRHDQSGRPGAAMLIPMDGIYHWMGKQSKSVFGGNKPPPDIGNKNIPSGGDGAAPPRDAPPTPPQNQDVTPPPPHGDNPRRAELPAPRGRSPGGRNAAARGPSFPRRPAAWRPSARSAQQPRPDGPARRQTRGLRQRDLGQPFRFRHRRRHHPRSGMVANSKVPSAHSSPAGAPKAPEPIKAPEAAPKPAPAPTAKPADAVAVKDAPVRPDVAAQHADAPAPVKSPAEPPKDLIAMGPRPEVTAAPHQAAPHQPKPADMDANLGRGPPQKGGDFDPLHADADGKLKTPEAHEGNLKEPDAGNLKDGNLKDGNLKDPDGDFKNPKDASPKEGNLKEPKDASIKDLRKTKDQGFSDRTAGDPKPAKSPQPRRQNTKEPRKSRSSEAPSAQPKPEAPVKPVESNPKPADSGTPAKEPAPAAKPDAPRPADAPGKPRGAACPSPGAFDPARAIRSPGRSGGSAPGRRNRAQDGSRQTRSLRPVQ